jgi:hypothetical protein
MKPEPSAMSIVGNSRVAVTASESSWCIHKSSVGAARPVRTSTSAPGDLWQIVSWVEIRSPE